VGAASLVTVGLLGIGGCVLAVHSANKRAAEISVVVADYLRKDPKIPMVLGSIREVDRKIAGWKVETVNGRDEAYFTYTLQTARGGADAEVWLVRPEDGTWQAAGAVIQGRLTTAKAPLIRIGKPGKTPKDYYPLE